MEKCIVRSKQEDIYKKYKPGEAAECALVVAVLGRTDQKSFSQYELVSYVSVQRLRSDRVVQANVRQDGYQYFLYEMQCDTCSLMVGLQTFSGGDPDLYILHYRNDTETRLPGKDFYDFKSAEYGSEAVELDLDNPYFKKNNLKTMRGVYVFAVHGKKAGTFLLSASASQHKISPLQEGLPLKSK